MVGRYIMIAALVTATVALAACNTVRGAGRDIERGGQAVQRGTR